MSGLKGCTYIYAPAGQAGEYAPLACNPYRGCGHGCAYCYVPLIGVDSDDCEKFCAPNSKHYTLSIVEFVETHLRDFDQETTFAICSYVPGDHRAAAIVRASFTNIFTYYPARAPRDPLRPRVAALPITEEEIPESKWNDRPTEPGEWGDEGYRNCEKQD